MNQVAGAGRADITLTGGDLPFEKVSAVECWGSDFFQVYYEDSVGYASKEGDVSACAYASLVSL